MTVCYDRANERDTFNSTSKESICFLNSKRNGITTFLFNVLQDKQYVFITENGASDIVFDFGAEKVEEFSQRRRSFLEIQEDFLESAKIFMNLFYIVDIGTFFRNMGVDLLNSQTKYIEYKQYSFRDFLQDYANQSEYKNNQSTPIYLIIDHAERCSYRFLYKVKQLAQITSLKFVFCIDSAARSAEMENLFEDCEEIDFSPPLYKDAQVIFDNLKMDKRFYNKKMYENSNNLIEFFGEYQKKRRESNGAIVDNNQILLNHLTNIKVQFTKKDFEIICKHLEEDARINRSIDAVKTLDTLCSDGTIFLSDNNSYSIAEAYLKNTLDFSYLCSLAKYAFEFYFELSPRFAVFLFTTCKETMKETKTEILLDMLTKCNITDQINQIIDFVKQRKITYYEYLAFNKYLFQKQLYDSMFDFVGPLPSKFTHINRLIQLIIKDRNHKKIMSRQFLKEYNYCIKTYKNKDLHCLLAIIYLDFCINHDKKRIKLFITKKSNLFYENFSKSKYYYILENIIAFYVPQKSEAIRLFCHAIDCASSKFEKGLICNNKFVYILNQYLQNEELSSELRKAYETLNEYKRVIQSERYNTNIILYQSLLSQKNLYEKQNGFDLSCASRLQTQTHEFYKVLNSYILDFLFTDSLSLPNYMSLEPLIKKANRIPTQNLYYYTMYLIALYTKDKTLLKHANKNLTKSKNFKCSNLFFKYKKLKRAGVTADPKQYCGFGFIFARLIQIPCLFDEIAELIKYSTKVLYDPKTFRK